MSREEWSKISGHPFCAYAACFAVLPPVGGALFRRFFTTDFPDFNGREKAQKAQRGKAATKRNSTQRRQDSKAQRFGT
jgi:hypothetical protein